MCKLGFDIRIHEMSQTDQQYCKEAVANFKRLDDVILDGDQYRLQSPYESQHAAVMYTNDNADKAVLFAFDIHPRYAESIQPLRFTGLEGGCPLRIERNQFGSGYAIQIGLQR